MVEITPRVNYNHAVSTARILGPFVLALLCPLMMGGACEKKTNKPPDSGALTALDRTGSATALDTTPLKDVDISKLDKDRTAMFYRLIGTLKSPCGKGENLRKSYTSDTSCKRAPFAVKLVLSMLEDEFPEDKARDDYMAKYENIKTYKLDTSKAPTFGRSDALARIAEFYDYACGHCKEFKPVLDAVMAKYEGKISVSFMMFPLGHWPESKSAAQASLAAHAQGKFKEMHTMLFSKGTAHAKADVMGYAKEIGLDMPKFEQAYDAAGLHVEADKKIGGEAGVDSTPAIYFNERKYTGPLAPKYFGLWIEEELGVN
jgi:protein-disulfide isomerase